MPQVPNIIVSLPVGFNGQLVIHAIHLNSIFHNLGLSQQLITDINFIIWFLYCIISYDAAMFWHGRL
jgi:uncharacterized membrane protein